MGTELYHLFDTDTEKKNFILPLNKFSSVQQKFQIISNIIIQTCAYPTYFYYFFHLVFNIRSL